jgi:hypothetical protein
LASSLKYKENLPSNCPQTDSQDIELVDVWRFLEAKTPAETCFDSHAAKNRPNKKNLCECGWASCSLFIGDEFTAAMIKLPYCKKFVARAELKIPFGSGKSKVEDKHIDFWAYKGFDFLSSVVRVEPK